MTMTKSDTLDVLTAIAAYDLRTVGESDVTAWHLAINDLPKDLALEAVVIHHKTSTERIKPANVIGIAKSIRRDRSEREDAEARDARAAAHDRRHGLKVVQGDPQLGNLPIGGADGPPVPGAYMVNNAFERTCPTCNAEELEPCTNPHTGNARRIPCLRRMSPKTA